MLPVRTNSTKKIIEMGNISEENISSFGISGEKKSMVKPLFPWDFSFWVI